MSEHSLDSFTHCDPVSEPETFTKRELEILTLMSHGFSTMAIARKLRISPQTVSTHRRNMLRKSQSRNAVELVVKCVRNGHI